MPLITLTTDFGSSDSYVGQMKGVILAIHPQALIVDITHAIPPQNIRRGADVLCEIAGVFPIDAIHVAVVDPGVGSRRALLAAETARGRFLAPDNGILRPVFRSFPPERLHRLESDRFWRAPVSATFHGRDILAPVAAHWCRGAKIADFGPPIDGLSLVDLPAIEVCRLERALVGQVDVVDAFGNLITNIRESNLPTGDRRALSVAAGNARIQGISRSYSDVPAGTVLALIGSSERLEIAVNQGNAAARFGLGAGVEVRVEPVS